MITVVRYIEGNSVRAGLAGFAVEWIWLSHNDRIIGNIGALSPLPIELRDNWTKYVDTPLTDTEIEKLRKSVNRQAPYGEEGWQMRISAALALNSIMKTRGKPRKV